MTFVKGGQLTIIELLFTFHARPLRLITQLFVVLPVLSIDNKRFLTVKFQGFWLVCDPGFI